MLRGGGIPNVEVIASEVRNMLTGRADQIHDFLKKLDTFTARLNEQRDDITRAIDSTDRLLTYVAKQSDTLDHVLTEFPPLAKHFAEQRQPFLDATNALGRFSDVLNQTLTAARPDLDKDVRQLQRPLKQLSRASMDLVETLKIALTLPFSADAIPKVVHGDSMNVSITLDLTLSAIDNALLTGTGFSGALRALEQSWGRDPNTMLPDVRFAPNPADEPPERDEE